MELKEWYIDPSDLHILTIKQHSWLINYHVYEKALGAYLTRGKQIIPNIIPDDPIILGKSPNFTIYLAEWRGLLVAVKRLDIQQDENGMDSHLKHEIGILVKMHHPNIIQILGITIDPFQIILEYFPHRDLTYVQKTRTLKLSSFSTKMRWTVDLLLALIYLHERKPQSVIHRDLKPSNLLIAPDGTLKITDFGLSKLWSGLYYRMNLSDHSLHEIDKSLKEDDTYTYDIGTYWYMSPELRNRIPYDYKMDIWSLGLILYEIWEERRIFQILESPIHLITYNEDRLRLLRFSYKTPSIIKLVIEKCLSLEPDSRPEVRNILAQVCQVKRPWWHHLLPFKL